MKFLSHSIQRLKKTPFWSLVEFITEIRDTDSKSFDILVLPQDPNTDDPKKNRGKIRCKIKFCIPSKYNVLVCESSEFGSPFENQKDNIVSWWAFCTKKCSKIRCKIKVFKFWKRTPFGRRCLKTNILHFGHFFHKWLGLIN